MPPAVRLPKSSGFWMPTLPAFGYFFQIVAGSGLAIVSRPSKLGSTAVWPAGA